MEYNNLKIIQLGNNTIIPISTKINELKSFLLNKSINNLLSDTTTIEISDGTVTNNVNIHFPKNKIFSNFNFFNGNNISSFDILRYNNHFKIDLPADLNINDRFRYFAPNANKAISIDLPYQIIDLTFILNRFELYSKMNAVDNIIIPIYEDNIVIGIVVRTGFTFLSNLKLMSKDIQFDKWFKDNPTKQKDYLLESVRLVSDNTIYDGTVFDLDVLNLVKLNIGVVNSLDWYVSYSVRNTITDEEIEFIKNKCKLQYKFVYRYNSTQFFYSNKKIIIGK